MSDTPEVTADNLTDDQLRVFRRAIRIEIEELIALQRDCSDLIDNAKHQPSLVDHWRVARTRIADAINARAKAVR